MRDAFAFRKGDDRAAVCQDRVDLLEVIRCEEHRAVLESDKCRLKIIVEHTRVIRLIGDGQKFIINTGAIAATGHLISSKMYATRSELARRRAFAMMQPTSEDWYTPQSPVIPCPPSVCGTLMTSVGI